MFRRFFKTPVQACLIAGVVADVQVTPALVQDCADSAWRCKIGIGISAQQSPFQIVVSLLNMIVKIMLFSGALQA